jgi:hypothetical protein
LNDFDPTQLRSQEPRSHRLSVSSFDHIMGDAMGIARDANESNQEAQEVNGSKGTPEHRVDLDMAGFNHPSIDI